MVRKRPWLFVWTSVSSVVEMLSAATVYLLREILPPAHVVFFLAYKMLPVLKCASLVSPHQRGDMLLTGSSPRIRRYME